MTADLLVNNAWKDKKFKPYNFEALGSTLDVGHLHPLLKVRSEFRKIFFEMGYIRETISSRYYSIKLNIFLYFFKIIF